MTVCDPQSVLPEHIIDSVDVRAMAGIQSRATLIAWRRDRDFPPPITRTGSGLELWDRRDVETWLRGRH